MYVFIFLASVQSATLSRLCDRSSLPVFSLLLPFYVFFDLVEERLHLRLRSPSRLPNGHLLVALYILAPVFQL